MKLLDDVALTDGTWFNFELVDESGKVVKTVQSVNGFADFSLAELKLDKPGIYRYTVRERNDGGHFRYDSTVYYIAVEVTQPNLAKPLEATISYYDKDIQPLNAEDLNFRNYRLPAQVNLTAAKHVNGQPGDGFKFLLDGGEGVFVCDKHVHTAGCYNRKLTCGQQEGPDHTHTDDCYVLVCGQDGDPSHVHSDACYEKELVCGLVEDPNHPAHTRDCYQVDNAQAGEATASGGVVRFGTLSFDKVGTYVYRVSELDEGEAYVWYYKTEYLVVIDVFINDANEMEAKVTTLLDGNEVPRMEFKNRRETPVVPFDPTAALTGDEANNSLWLALMGAALAGLTATLAAFGRKNRRKHNKG